MGLFTSLCLFALMGTLLCESDYYWRPYNGLIPDDAIVGRSVGGFNAYIGSTATEDGVYVGELQGGVQSLTVYAWTIIYTTNQHIEILCSSHPENFEWVPVTQGSVFDIPVNNRVIGGYDLMYNGSHTVARESSDLPVGWALTGDNRVGGFMCYAFNQTEHECANAYFVLTYNDNTIKEAELAEE